MERENGHALPEVSRVLQTVFSAFLFLGTGCQIAGAASTLGLAYMNDVARHEGAAHARLAAGLMILDVLN